MSNVLECLCVTLVWPASTSWGGFPVLELLDPVVFVQLLKTLPRWFLAFPPAE